MKPVTTKTMSAAWRDIPSACLVCEKDCEVLVRWWDAMVAVLKKAGDVVDTERITTSHSPHVLRPDAVASFIKRAAAGSVRRMD
jgi:hypothetical protein